MPLALILVRIRFCEAEPGPKFLGAPPPCPLPGRREDAPPTYFKINQECHTSSGVTAFAITSRRHLTSLSQPLRPAQEGPHSAHPYRNACCVPSRQPVQSHTVTPKFLPLAHFVPTFPTSLSELVPPLRARANGRRPRLEPGCRCRVSSNSQLCAPESGHRFGRHSFGLRGRLSDFTARPRGDLSRN